MKKAKRIPLWDNLKLLLIFLVVLGHFVDFYTSKSSNMRVIYLYLYLFHIPLFIFINGIFSQKAIAKKDYKKVAEYFILYLFVNFITFSFHLLFSFIFKIPVPSLDLFSNSNPPWFLFAIFVFNILTILFNKIDKKSLLIGSIILACFIGYDKNINDLFELSRIIVFYPFFLAGYIINQKKLLSFLKAKKIQIISLALIIATFICVYLFIDKIYFIRPLITGRNPFYTLKEYYAYGGLLRLLYYPVAFALSFAFIAIIPKSKTFLTKLGSRTLAVYIFHYPILYLLIYLGINNFFDNTSYLLIIPISVILTFILSNKYLLKLIKNIVSYFTKPATSKE